MSNHFTIVDCMNIVESEPTASAGAGAAALGARYQRAVESIVDLLNDYVDPDEAYYDETGLRWLTIGGAGTEEGRVPFDSERGLEEIRQECRILGICNEFAINAQENRISYLVGCGHKYTVSAKKGLDIPPETLRPVQELLDGFVKATDWPTRQQEIVRRRDRDGEVFVRFFTGADGRPVLRFIEPSQVYTPESERAKPEASFGILCDPNDVETVLAYYVDGRPVPASQIQHRKGGVDRNVKRGLPLFYPVRRNLRRAEKLLRNMSTVAEIQAAIAMIRKNPQGTSGTLSAMITGSAEASYTNQVTGKTDYFKRYAPGTIINTNAGVEYEFPSAHVNPGAYVPVLQAELRAIASRLVMPEFMLTSDASNANYASTMVAEGPAVKMFQRLQYQLVSEDQTVFDRVLDGLVATGHLSEDLRQSIQVDIEPPNLAVRDRLAEVNADTTLVRERIMSRRTAMLRNNLDPEIEKPLIEEEREQDDPYAGLDVTGLGAVLDKARGGKDADSGEEKPADGEDGEEGDDDGK